MNLKTLNLKTQSPRYASEKVLQNYLTVPEMVVEMRVLDSKLTKSCPHRAVTGQVCRGVKVKQDFNFSLSKALLSTTFVPCHLNDSKSIVCVLVFALIHITELKLQRQTLIIGVNFSPVYTYLDLIWPDLGTRTGPLM